MPFVASVRPAGSVPVASVNVAVPNAPVWVKFWLKGTPAVPVLTAGLVMMMMLQQVGRAGTPAGSDGAAGEQTPVCVVGKTPVGTPLAGNVEPLISIVPQADRSMVPWSEGENLAPPLLRNTAAAAVRGEAHLAPGGADLAAQFARLAFPLTLSEQGPFNALGIPAVLLSRSGERRGGVSEGSRAVWGPRATPRRAPHPSRALAA